MRNIRIIETSADRYTVIGHYGNKDMQRKDLSAEDVVIEIAKFLQEIEHDM